MTEDKLVEGLVSTSQISKAIEALYAYEKKKQAQAEETELLPGKEPTICLIVTFKRIQIPLKDKIRPIKMYVLWYYPLCISGLTTSLLRI